MVSTSRLVMVESVTLTARPRTVSPTGADLAARYLWWILGLSSAAWAADFLISPATSWRFFDTAAKALLAVHDPHGGLHLYHFNPDLQFGPVAVLAAVPFSFLPLTVGVYAVALPMAGAGLLTLRGIFALVPRDESWRLLITGLFVLPAWMVLAVAIGHIDDVIALTATVWAMVSIRHGHAYRAGLLLAVAADAKPWALAFVPLLLALPAKRVRALAVWFGVAAVLWAPFLIADPGSVAAAGFRLAVSPASVLHLFDSSAASTPWWCRPVQLVGGVLLGYVLWRRHRTVAIIGAVLALRVATDPATWTYYTAGVVVGAALLDLARRGRRPYFPWLTALALITLLVPALIHAGPLADPTVRAVLRLACCAAVLGFALFGRYRDLLTPAADGPVRPAPSPQ